MLADFDTNNMRNGSKGKRRETEGGYGKGKAVIKFGKGSPLSAFRLQ